MADVRADVAATVGEALDAGAGVTVIRAAPGGGKTAGAVQAVAARLRDPQVRVVWAVRETVAIAIRKGGGMEALAEQTVAELNRAAGRDVAHVIAGRRHLDEEAYLAQLRWPRPVAVVAHAHLPLLLRPDLQGPLRQLRGAQAVVIDEDPLGALTLHGGLRAEGLRSLPLRQMGRILAGAAATATEREAVDLLMSFEQGWPVTHAALLPAVREFGVSPQGRRASESVLRGASFLAIVSPALTLLRTSCVTREQVRDALAAHLRPDRPDEPLTAGGRHAIATTVIEALLSDLAAYEAGVVTTRFGLTWKGGAGATYGKSLAWDLLLPVRVDRPVIVLDAYADGAQYRAVFGDGVRIVDVGPRPPLRVELAPTLGLEQNRLEARRAQLVAQEIHTHAARAPRGQLLLAPKDAVLDVQGLLARAATLAGAPPADVAVMHWYSGRGVNHHHGRDVRALTLPHLPAAHEVCTLSALYPLASQTIERSLLRAHHERTELLQLLHRGRQGQHPPGTAPRAVLHGLPCDLCPREARAGCRAEDAQDPQPCSRWAGLITLDAYDPAVPTRALSRNPVARATLAAVAADLHALCGGVPLLALQALGLVPGGGGAELNSATQTLLREARRPELRTLAAWRGRWLAVSGPHAERRLQVWPGMSPLRDTSRRLEDEVLGGAPLGYRRWRVRGPSRRIPHVVWAQDEVNARHALEVLLSRR
ncbi:hypothetical protein [Deinococcus yunweiensis]|uniref:hypothetical protein n=1 Tax=Deinococcus yunweiensis TaxID=367282 RepID=UPI00398EA75D